MKITLEFLIGSKESFMKRASKGEVSISFLIKENKIRSFVINHMANEIATYLYLLIAFFFYPLQFHF